MAALAGKAALVTGAGTGIGRAIARALAAAGARVMISDVDVSAAQRVATEIGATARGVQLDVTDAAATARAIEATLAAFGRLDVVAANAGISTMNRVVDLTEDEWDRNMDVNAKGIFLTNQAAVRHWTRTGASGVIVNTASLAGKVGAALLAHYSASKFAVVGFTQALAREVAAQGIRVNCVCPGYVRTSMQTRELAWEAQLRGMNEAAVIKEYVTNTPLGRLEEPEDVADVVVFLASDASRFMTGQAVGVDGGIYMG